MVLKSPVSYIRRRLWRIIATYLLSRDEKGCSRGLRSSAGSSRNRWIRGRPTHPFFPKFFKLVPNSGDDRSSHKQRFPSIRSLLFLSDRDALNKMKDVYEKNPQMGDPNSLQPKISETICNMEKLRSEIHKNEVRILRRVLRWSNRSPARLWKWKTQSDVCLCSRPGCLRWRGSRAPEETEDPAQTITSTPPKAERGKLLPHTPLKSSSCEDSSTFDLEEQMFG